jgi:type II secretory pathway pseudopilin PulG
MRRRAGFSLAELLVAATIACLLVAGLLAIVATGRSAARTRAAAIDIQQRLRAAVEAMDADIAAAGTGPVNAVGGRPLGVVVPSILPYRVGPRGDPPGTVRQDAITVLSVPGSGAGTVLATDFLPGATSADIAQVPGCPVGDPSCGIGAGTEVLLLDGRGQLDIYRVDAVAGASLTLSPFGTTSGRGFPADSAVVPLSVVTYFLKPGPPGEAGQLVSAEGAGADMPAVDPVAGLSFQLLAEPRPPVLRGAAPARTSYGPVPPPPGVDDPRDSWPPGENCIIASAGSAQMSRLPSLTTEPGLVPLPAGMLTDGPWCPDQGSSVRHDADLLRVRAVRVTLRLEASSREFRGTDARLFAYPGTARVLAATAVDRQVVFDVVARAVQWGR